MRKIILMILSAALMAACGDDGGSSVVKLNADQQEQVETSSQALVESGAEVGALKTDPGAEMTFASLGSVFGSASALWSTKMAAKAGSAGSPYDTAYGTLESSKFALTTDCYTVSGDTVTYDCNEAGYGIVGSVTVSGDTIEIDLALETQGYTFIYTGKITVTDTLIDGWLAFDGP